MKRYILLIVLVSMIALSPMSSVAAGYSMNDERSVKKLAYSDSISDSIIITSVLDESSIMKDFPLQMLLFGYKITPRSDNPLDWDDNGTLTLLGASLDSVSVILNLKCGVYEYHDVCMKGVQCINSAGKSTYDLEVDDIRNGFFMELVILPEITFAEVAFDGGESQLCYRGLARAGNSLMRDPILSGLESMESDRPSFLLPQYASEYASLSFEELSQKLRADYQTSIQIYVNPFFQRSLELSANPSTEVSPDIVIPEVARYGISYQETLFDMTIPSSVTWEYWTSNGVDEGIYRKGPTKAQIKSDLQYYNKDVIGRYRGYENDIVVFSIVAHGNPNQNTNWKIEENGTGTEWLTYQEVAQLWYHSYNPSTGVTTDVHPTHMILLATTCYGYSGTDGIPHMAKAFVDYGASAFVGATVEIPSIHYDEYADDFWSSLCDYRQTVYTATISFINAHNTYYPNDLWTYNAQIRIYGNTNAMLDV